MTNVINVDLAFDCEAHVWHVQLSDVHGLRIEADTVDALIARIPDARFTVDGKIMSRHTANVTLEDAGLDKAF